MTAWTFLQLQIKAEDALILPMVGPGGLTRDAAHAEVQAILDAAGLVRVAAMWRRGAQDDVVHHGPGVWAIIEHDGDDPMPAARKWIDDFAEIMRSAGLDVQVGQPPAGDRRRGRPVQPPATQRPRRAP